MKELLKVSDLHVKYGEYEAVKGVSFSLGAGEILGIVGESGSGKSTIAKTLMGLERPSSGEIAIAPGARLQMIFQDAVGSLNPRMTVRRALEEAIRHGRAGTAGAAAAAVSAAAPAPPSLTSAALLDLVGLSKAVLDQYPREMSGGQCQRVSIARALAVGPSVLVADEPTSMIDACSRSTILDMLLKLRDEKDMTILFITHDLGLAYYVSDTLYIMEHGKMVETGPADELILHPTHRYTKQLVTDVPKLHEEWDLEIDRPEDEM